MGALQEVALCVARGCLSLALASLERPASPPLQANIARPPSWEETLTIKSSGNVRRAGLAWVPVEDTTSRSAAEPGASAPPGPLYTLSFIADTSEPARATLLFGVQRKLLTLANTTVSLSFHRACPSVLLPAGLGQHVTPEGIALALQHASTFDASVGEWCSPPMGDCQHPPVDLEGGKFSLRHEDALLVLESGSGLRWDDEASGPVHAVQSSEAASLRCIVGFQRLSKDVLEHLANAPALGSPLQVQLTSLAFQSAPHSPSSSAARDAAPPRATVEEQVLHLEGQAFSVQEIFGLEDSQLSQASPTAQEPDTGLAAASEGTLCLICLTEARNTIMLPCRHVCVCDGCAQELRARRRFTCPVCRSAVTTLMQVRSVLPASEPAIEAPSVPGAVAVEVAPP